MSVDNYAFAMIGKEYPNYDEAPEHIQNMIDNDDYDLKKGEFTIVTTEYASFAGILLGKGRDYQGFDDEIFSQFTLEEITDMFFRAKKELKDTDVHLIVNEYYG